MSSEARTTCQEPKIQEVKLDDDHPEAVEMLLLHLYTLQLPEAIKTAPLVHVQLNELQMLFVIADKYAAFEMKERAKRLMIPAVSQGIAGLKGQTQETLAIWIPEWINWFDEVWMLPQTGADDIRHAAMVEIVKVADYLIEREDMKRLLSKNSAFAFDFVKAMNSRITELEGNPCPKQRLESVETVNNWQSR